MVKVIVADRKQWGMKTKTSTTALGSGLTTTTHVISSDNPQYLKITAIYHYLEPNNQYSQCQINIILRI